MACTSSPSMRTIPAVLAIAGVGKLLNGAHGLPRQPRLLLKPPREDERRAEEQGDVDEPGKKERGVEKGDEPETPQQLTGRGPGHHEVPGAQRHHPIAPRPA